MINKIIKKLVDLSFDYGWLSHKRHGFIFDYVENSTEITEQSKNKYEELKTKQEKLKAQIEILKEVLENDK